MIRKLICYLKNNYPYFIRYEDFVIEETDPEKIKIIQREKKLERICQK